MQLSAFPFSTILFDLDGTLVDSAPDVLEAIAAVLLPRAFGRIVSIP